MTANLKFEMFEDYLRSELKSKRLEYVLDNDKHDNVSETKLTDDKERVRDIIINHIDIKYYTKIVELREPQEILNKLKEYKRQETRVTSVSARKDLYSLKFNPKKERAAEFWDKFEEKVKVYENIPEAGKMTEKEKRDIFMHAIVESVSGVEVYNCLSRQATGKDATYEALKNIFYRLKLQQQQQQRLLLKKRLIRPCCPEDRTGLEVAKAGAELEERAVCLGI